MFSSGQVKARVVDVWDSQSRLPSEIVCDTQVLFWHFYRRRNAFAALWGSFSPHSQTQGYMRFFIRLLRSEVAIYTSTANLLELARLIDYRELLAHHLTQSSCLTEFRRSSELAFPPPAYKELRYIYASELHRIRSKVSRVLALVRTYVAVLPAISNADNECTHALSEWIECSADNADALIVAQAKSRGIFHILSDDLDFATMSGITLYSANQAVVNSARIAGKLVSTSCGSVHIKR